MSAAQKARRLREPVIRHSEETKAKMRKPRSEVGKQNMRAAWSPERRAEYARRTSDQRAREALERVNWIAWG